MATRHDPHRSRSAMIGAIGLLLVVMLVMMLAGRGAFAVLGPSVATGVAPPIPGVTLDDSSLDRVPVVTSLRTHSEAERRGVRVGDRIQAVDGRHVRDLAALREAVAQHSGAVPVSLKIQRGDMLWDVALDRAEPPADRPDPAASPNEPEDPAGRGR